MSGIAGSMLLLMGVGGLLAWRGWINEPVRDFMADLVTKVALPAIIISNLNEYFTRDDLWLSLSNIYIPCVALAAGMGLSWICSALFRIQKNRRGVFAAICAYPNSVFLGLPICIATFGQAAAPIALYYYLGATVMFWTIGLWGMARDGRTASAESKTENKTSILNTITRHLKLLFSPAIITVLAVCLQISLGIKLPDVILRPAGYLASLCVPLALLFIGATLFSAFKAGVRWYKGMAWMLFARAVVSPALCFCAVALFNAPPLIAQVFVLQSAMPAMSQTPMVARSCGADDAFAAAGTALSTIACMVCLPLVRVVQTVVYGS